MWHRAVIVEQHLPDQHDGSHGHHHGAQEEGTELANFVFLDNFTSIMGNTAFRRAVHNTFMFSAVAVPLAVVLSLLLAIVLEAKLPFRSQFRTFFLSPMMVPVASIVN